MLFIFSKNSALPLFMATYPSEPVRNLLLVSLSERRNLSSAIQAETGS
jgi:hypothetical protein